MSERAIQVMLVDDEAELVEFLAKRLKRKGLDVTAMTSAKEALDKLDDQAFDVVVLDLKMPEMDGLQALREIKARQPFTQVVMLTGHGSLDTALESGRQHAYRFLSKPAEFSELLEVVKEAAARKRKDLRRAYDEEVAELMSTVMDPSDILTGSKKLREKYFQED